MFVRLIITPAEVYFSDKWGQSHLKVKDLRAAITVQVFASDITKIIRLDWLDVPYA